MCFSGLGRVEPEATGMKSFQNQLECTHAIATQAVKVSHVGDSVAEPCASVNSQWLGIWQEQ